MKNYMMSFIFLCQSNILINELSEEELKQHEEELIKPKKKIRIKGSIEDYLHDYEAISSLGEI